MPINAIAYLEAAISRAPDRIVYTSPEQSLTVSQLSALAKRMGCLLATHTRPCRPVVVLAGRHVTTPALYLAVLLAGCYYVPLGDDLPPYRRQAILDAVGAKVVLTANPDDESLNTLSFDGTVLTLADVPDGPPDETLVLARRGEVIDTDPCCVLFTSGSSGKPKGVVLTHRNLIEAIDVYADVFSIGADDVLGGQAPLDYIAAIRDLYLPLCTGAQTVFIPKKLFSAPKVLFEFLNVRKVTTLFWAAPALSLCAELDVFSSVTLETVRKVIFTGSVLPCRHLRRWQDALPGAYFANHYGPTEITGSCMVHVVGGPVSEQDVLPIGRPFPNTRILLLDDRGRPVPDGQIGELAVAGSRVAAGYWGEAALTEAAFVRQMREGHPETLYKTGDLAHRDADGVFWFHGRRDRQIKHMGHRVELDEIEALCLTVPGLTRCACLYHEASARICLFYTGQTDSGDIAKILRARLPSYMIPRKFTRMERLPETPNGKVDGTALAALLDG